MQIRPIDEVLDAHTGDLMSLPGVVGTGMGLCKEQPCIHVYIDRIDSTVTSSLPCELEGYKVRIVVSGKVFALD